MFNGLMLRRRFWYALKVQIFMNTLRPAHFVFPKFLFVLILWHFEPERIAVSDYELQIDDPKH